MSHSEEEAEFAAFPSNCISPFLSTALSTPLQPVAEGRRGQPPFGDAPVDFGPLDVRVPGHVARCEVGGPTDGR